MLRVSSYAPAPSQRTNFIGESPLAEKCLPRGARFASPNLGQCALASDVGSVWQSRTRGRFTPAPAARAQSRYHGRCFWPSLKLRFIDDCHSVPRGPHGPRPLAEGTNGLLLCQAREPHFVPTGINLVRRNRIVISPPSIKGSLLLEPPATPNTGGLQCRFLGYHLRERRPISHQEMWQLPYQTSKHGQRRSFRCCGTAHNCH